MTTRTAISHGHQIYSKRYFDASLTWCEWNKLTAADVHALRKEQGFEGQNICFHLNHPIRFVRLVGLVVDIEITKNAKHILISLDDGSGECIEVKTSLRDVGKDDHGVYPSNTVVDTLDVHMHMSIATVYVNKQPIDVGTVIKAKGTLDSFRNRRQLKLERVWIVRDTNEEVQEWSKTAQWKRDVLSKPWVLTKDQQNAIDEQISRDALKEREKSKKKRVWDAKREEKKQMHVEKVERRRKREEERLNAGALPGSAVLPGRVTDP